MRFKPVAVSTEGLQVGWVIIKAITVYVVYIQLADMYWLKGTVFAVVFLIHRIRIDRFVMVSFIDRLAFISTSDWFFLISYLNLSGATN